MKIIIDEVERDVSHWGNSVLGASLYATTPNVDEQGYILLECRHGEPDILVKTSDVIQLKDGMRFLFVPRSTFGG